MRKQLIIKGLNMLCWN